MKSYRYSCQILMKLDFCRQSFEKTQISNFMQTPAVGVEFSIRTDRRTDERTNIRTDRQTWWR